MSKQERRIKEKFSDFSVQKLSVHIRNERIHEYLSSRATPEMDYRGQRGVFLVKASHAAENIGLTQIIGTFEGLFEDVLGMAVGIEEFWPFAMPNYSGYIYKLDVIPVHEGGVLQLAS